MLSVLFLDETVAQLPAPDLTDPLSRSDYRGAVLVAIVRQLQTLHLRPADAALHLHGQIVKHLWALHAIDLLDDDRIQLALADLKRAYEREHPGLLESVSHA
jgi:hypothetical protein